MKLNKKQKHEINNFLQNMLMDKDIGKYYFFTCNKISELFFDNDYGVTPGYAESLHLQNIRRIARQNGLDVQGAFSEYDNQELIKKIRTEAIIEFSKWINSLEE